MDAAKSSLGPLIMTASLAGNRSGSKGARRRRGRRASRAEPSRLGRRRRPWWSRFSRFVGRTGFLAALAVAAWAATRRPQNGRVPAEPARKGASGQPELDGSGDRQVTYHVSPKDQGGWAVVKEGAQRATLTGATKRDVVKQARELAREKQAHLVIHRADGAVQDEVSYD